MKTKKPEFEERITVLLDATTVAAIQKSGQNGPDWLRQAARNRLESERQAATPTSTLEKRLDAFQQQIDRLQEKVMGTQREIAKLQQSETLTQTTQADLRKALAAVQKNQVEVHALLVGIDRNFGNALNALGPSLLAVLSQQLRDILKAKDEEEPPPFKLPPIPPRTRL